MKISPTFPTRYVLTYIPNLPIFLDLRIRDQHQSVSVRSTKREFRMDECFGFVRCGTSFARFQRVCHFAN